MQQSGGVSPHAREAYRHLIAQALFGLVCAVFIVDIFVYVRDQGG